MRQFRLYTKTLAVLLVLSTFVVAATNVVWDAGYPSSPAVEKINSSGSFTRVNLELIYKVTTTAIPVGMGTGGYVDCTVSLTATSGTYIGSITTNLKSGEEYNVKTAVYSSKGVAETSTVKLKCK